MRQIKKGATSQSVYFVALDSTSTTGGRKTGLVFNTAGLTAYYARNQGSATAITLATLAAANSAFSSGGFKEVDATNMPGLYRLDVPDAAFASGADSVVISIKGATGMVQADIEVQLTGVDLQDATALGVSRLDAAISSRMATFTLPSNFALLAIDGSGRVTVGTNADKTGYALTQTFPANFSAMAITAGGAVTVGTNNDKSGYSLTQSFPANFASLAITGGGAVTVGTNGDKTGYSLSQAFPTNFSALSITAAGRVDVAAVAGTAQTARDLGAQLDAAVSTRLAAVSYTAPLDAAGTRTAIGLASANLDTQLSTILGAIPSLANINAEVVDALSVDTYAEPGQNTPAATASLASKIGYIYKMTINKKEQTASEFRLYNAAGSTVDQKSAVSDDGTTHTRAQLVTGP